MNKLRKVLAAVCAVAVVSLSSAASFAQDNVGIEEFEAPTLAEVGSQLGIQPSQLATSLVSYTGTFFITMLFLAFAISIGWVILRQFKRAAKQM